MPHLLLTPEECQTLVSIQVPNPRTGSLQTYFHDEDALKVYESTRYHDKYRSWFFDNLFCKEGHANILTPVDQLFLLVPIIRKIASSQFRSIDDICSTYLETSQKGSSRLDFLLSPQLDWKQICDIKQVDDTSYIRFDEDKCINWLITKYEKAIVALGQAMVSEQPSKATLSSYAIDLIDQYVSVDLSEKLKLNLRSTKNTIPTKTPTQSQTPTPNNNLPTSKRRSSGGGHPDNSAKLPKNLGILKFFKKN